LILLLYVGSCCVVDGFLVVSCQLCCFGRFGFVFDLLGLVWLCFGCLCVGVYATTFLFHICVFFFFGGWKVLFLCVCAFLYEF
jgi:hypothetical protein